MNILSIQDTITMAEGVGSENNISWWILASIAGIGVITFLSFKKSKTKNKSKSIEDEFRYQKIDFDNIIDSSFNAIKLYDILKVKCHPDRFSTDPEKNKIAEDLFQDISKNKTNIKRLIELKEEAITKLNIKL